MTEVSRVGPHGYIHGWIFVGAPGVGYTVHHPRHGHGTVTEASNEHVRVSFDSGHSEAFPVRQQKGPARFERMTDAELEHEMSTSEGKRFFAAMAEIGRRDHEGKAAQLRSLYSEKPKKAADKDRVYQRLVDLGENPEDAWSHAHGVNSEQMQQQAVIAQLRSQGYKGGGFDALTRDAFKHDVQRRVIDAEAATNGYMLSPEGKKADVDPWSLFTGPETRARKYASSELREWWDQHGRPTVADFQDTMMGRTLAAGPVGGDFYRTNVLAGDLRRAKAANGQPDRAGMLARARTEGWKAGRAYRDNGTVPDLAPDFTSGPLLLRQGASEWYRGFEDGRGGAAQASRASDSGIPGHFPHQLATWWEHGEGAAKIRWGQGGDFDRCVRLAVDEAHMDPERAKGFCAERHHAALGIWPATHAAQVKKETGRSAVTTMTERADAKPYGDVKYADPANGKYPIDTEDHARAAWSYINMPKNAAQYPMKGVTLGEVKDRIMAACKKFGIDVSSDSSTASRSDAVYFRTYELEDIHIVRAAQGDSTGRLVEAYAAVFNQPAEIHDFEGHYIEQIDPSAFNKVVADIGRSRAGFGKVKVMFNHGLTIHGTPSERGSMPIGTPVEIRPEARGLLTLTRYSETPFSDEVLENIRNGAITAQSFTGRIVRSDPQLRRGQQHRPRGGELPTVRRTELGLKEYGPTPFEAYSGAEILGVRMSTPGTWEPDGNEYEEALPLDEEAAAGEPLARTDSGDEDAHSARYHQHALYRMTSQEMRERLGLVW